MSHLLLDNVLAWGFQVAAIAALGLVLPVVFRMAAPHVRLTYLRALLVVCLALPLLQPWVPTAPAAAEALPLPAVEPLALAAGPADTVAPRQDPVQEAPLRWPAERVLLAVYVAGVVGRLAWMGLGLASLARLRRRSVPLAMPLEAVEDAMLKVGVRADFRVSDRVVRPATFGLRRPVVLVPPEFAAFPPDQQEAVAIHELLHVRRRDWVRTLGDSVVLSVCWFHPALWWLVEQIHLSVEQVVDREVVALSGRRKPYLEALLKLAAAGPAPLLQPASLFLKHGHLAERVALLVREVSMSRLRLAASSAAVLTTLVASGMFVVQAWPLRGPAEPASVAEPLDGRPVPVALSAAPTAEVGHPRAARPQTKPTVDPKHQAPRPGMPPPPPPPPPPPQPPPPLPPPPPKVQLDPARLAEQVAKAQELVQAAPGNAVAHYTLAASLWNKVYHDRTLTLQDQQHDIQWGLTAVNEALQLNPKYEDAFLYKNLLLRLAATHETDSARKAAWIAEADAVRDQALKLKQAVGVWAAIPANAVRVGGEVRPPTKIKDVRPEYPPTARDARVQGVVILETVVGEDGRVQASRVLRSIPFFDEAAMAAVNGWEFTPTLLNGVPVPVVMTVTVNFMLDGGAPPPPPPPPPPPLKGDLEARHPDAVRVGRDIRPPARVKDARPVYPTEAKEAGVQGVIIIEAVIGADGSVRDAKVLRSVPLLDEAALEAVRQWEFTPTVVDGKAVPVIMTVTVNFTLR